MRGPCVHLGAGLQTGVAGPMGEDGGSSQPSETACLEDTWHHSILTCKREPQEHVKRVPSWALGAETKASDLPPAVAGHAERGLHTRGTSLQTREGPGLASHSTAKPAAAQSQALPALMILHSRHKGHVVRRDLCRGPAQESPPWLRMVKKKDRMDSSCPCRGRTCFRKDR